MPVFTRGRGIIQVRWKMFTWFCSKFRSYRN